MLQATWLCRWIGFLGVLVTYLHAAGEPVAALKAQKRVAVLTTVYRHNSHADVIASRLLLTDMLDGTGKDSPL